MKKYVLIIILSIIAIASTSCQQVETILKYNDAYAQELCETVFNAILNEDFSSIESLFCQYTLDNYDMEAEFEKAMEFIEGDIVSYDEPDGSTGGESIENGIITEKTLHGYMTNIKTTTNKTYHVVYTTFAVNNEHPEFVGLGYIDFFDVDIYFNDDIYKESEDAGKLKIGYFYY